MEETIKILSDSLLSDIRSIIENGKRQAFNAVGQVTISTYWALGRRIVEEEQHGNARSEYGNALLSTLADKLTSEYGIGYNKRNLAYFRQLYLEFNDLEILHTRVQNLSWSHVRRLLSVSNPQAREWYLNAAATDMWSVRTLDRNISTQYYERRLAAQVGEDDLPIKIDDSNPMEYIKNPVVAEFMGFHNDNYYSESQLEQALIDNLEKFILELGRGFAFVQRQQHICTDTADFYIDLVFYNFKMRRFVLFELKTHKLTHQDIGQLDMYVRMYDDLFKSADDAPTIGVLLCTDTDSTIARYSVLHDNNQLYAAKYMTYMPTEDELQNEIERQKHFFLEQHGKR